MKNLRKLFLLSAFLSTFCPTDGHALPMNVPDFSLDTSRTKISSAKSGLWSDPTTWQGNQIPTSNQVANIATGHTVTIDDVSAVAYTVGVQGTLRFSPSVNTRLNVTNLLVMPATMSVAQGHLEVGTAASPIASTVTAEIIFADNPLGFGVADPEQFGNGLIGFGKTTMHGAIATPTFQRVATEPKAGNTTLSLSIAVSGWEVGDRLILPDTRHIKESEVTPANGWMNAVNQWEERTVSAISADGRTITLNTGLQFDHLGARDLNGVLDFLPHVGNLSRNVILRSENPSGTRGHTIFIHGAETDIRYVAFKDLGRTTFKPLTSQGGSNNQVGRYPIHMHHYSGPLTTPANGYQYTLLGNSVDGGSSATQFKWGITVHNSHYGLIQDNIVYNYNGSAIATEDGSESFNRFDHNFVMRGIGEPNNSLGEARMAEGTEGVGFWLRGPNNYVLNNVAANFQNSTTEGAYGFVYQFKFGSNYASSGNLTTIRIPNFKGADTSVAGQYTTRDGNAMSILQCENNEAYGAMQGGLTIWWAGSLDPQPINNAGESIIKDMKLWNIYNKTVYMYPAHKVTFDGLKIRAKFDATSRCCGNGVYFADYASRNIKIMNSDIQGVEQGITAPMAGIGPEAQLTIQNTFLRNHTNIEVPVNGSVNGCWMDSKLVVMNNVSFAAPPARSLSAVAMVGDVASAPTCLSIPNEAKVYSYNGNAADNFQVYSNNVSVIPRPPASCTPTTRAGIGGVVCPIAPLGSTDTTAPSVTITAPANNATISGTVTLTATATDNAAVAGVQFKLDGALLGTEDTTAPYTFSLNTTSYPNGTYTLTAVARDTSSNQTTSSPVTVTFDNVDTTIPVVSAVTVTAITATGATINFTTNEPAMHEIEYGTSTAYGSLTTHAMLMTSHSEVLSGLLPSRLYHFRIHAMDTAGNDGHSPDTTFTTLAAPPTNQVPTVNAGPDQTITLPASASLVGSAADDGLPNPPAALTRSWTKVSGPGTVVFGNSSSLSTSATFSAAGTYVLRLTVSDSALSASNDIQITVNPIPPPVNQIPTINAGTDQTVTFPSDANLIGSASDDGLPNPPASLTTTWSLVSGPGTVTFGNANSLSTTATFSVEGTFVLRLTASDSSLSSTDELTVIVNPTGTPVVNQPPVVNAGSDQAITLPANASLAGLAIDDGLPNPPAALSMTWSRVSGPGTVTFGNANSLSTTATFTQAGMHVLRLTVSDSDLSSIDTVTITVNTASAPQALMSASPALITAGQATTLSWIATNATSVSINQGIGTVSSSGSRVVNPTLDTTYTLTATGPGGTTTTSVTVTVQTSVGTPLPMPIFNLPTNVLPLNAEIQLTNAGSYAGATFTWNVTPIAPSAALGKSRSVSGVLGAPRPVLATSAVPKLSLASMNLVPGTYLITVQASVGSQTSALGSANVTLVQANLSAVRIYPNPWRSDRHAANRTITFDNLTVNTSIKIFTVAGHHVKTLPTANNNATWDLTNDSGDRVASGNYMYVMKAEDGSKKTGQIVVIK